jgi:hypothetical protein
MSSLLGTESERVYFVARNVYEVTWSLRGAAESFAGRLDREATEAFSSPQFTKRVELVLLCPIHHEFGSVSLNASTRVRRNSPRAKRLKKPIRVNLRIADK